MRRRGLDRVLEGCLAAGLLLPILLALVLGMGGLLGGLGDGAGAIACGRIGLGLGVLWAAAVATASLINGLLTLDGRRRRPRGKRRRLRRRPRRGFRPDAGGQPPNSLP